MMSSIVMKDRTKFGKKLSFCTFWSVGTGWNIHNEKFLKGSPFQLLKLRASLGYLGNISFEPYQALTMYTSLAGLNYIKGIGAVPMGIGNKNLKWREHSVPTSVLTSQCSRDAGTSQQMFM